MEFKFCNKEADQTNQGPVCYNFNINSHTMKNIILCLLIILPFSVRAQGPVQTRVQSIDGIVQELLDQITIDKGETMDTAAIRKLFYPSAQFTVLMHMEDGSVAESISLDDFLVMLKDPYYEEGYLEEEFHKVVDEYNGIAQVFQSFYGKAIFLGSLPSDGRCRWPMVGPEADRMRSNSRLVMTLGLVL